MIRTQTGPGGPVTAAIRPACAADAGALSDFFAGLSPQTRYLRFFAPVTPGPELLGRMSGGDGRTHAGVAVRGGVIVGHAMAADRVGPRGARTADVGVVVADAWQAKACSARSPTRKPASAAGASTGSPARALTYTRCWWR